MTVTLDAPPLPPLASAMAMLLPPIVVALTAPPPMPITVCQPSIAVMTAPRPTGPAPTIATVSPGFVLPLRMPISKPVGRASVRNKTSSSSRPSGTLCTEVSANGTRTYSACVPSMRCPNTQPTPPRVWQWEGWLFLQ